MSHDLKPIREALEKELGFWKLKLSEDDERYRARTCVLHVENIDRSLAHLSSIENQPTDRVKSIFTDEANLKAQISIDRIDQIQTHAEEGHKFGKSTNSVILELIGHIRAVEKVRDEWCMEYARLRDTPKQAAEQPVECRGAFEHRFCVNETWRNGDGYIYKFIQDKWIGWQAAWEPKRESVSRDAVHRIFNEIDCRIEHGAESNGHLQYVHKELKAILS